MQLHHVYTHTHTHTTTINSDTCTTVLFQIFLLSGPGWTACHCTDSNHTGHTIAVTHPLQPVWLQPSSLRSRVRCPVSLLQPGFCLIWLWPLVRKPHTITYWSSAAGHFLCYYCCFCIEITPRMATWWQTVLLHDIPSPPCDSTDHQDTWSMKSGNQLKHAQTMCAVGVWEVWLWNLKDALSIPR